MKILRCRDAGFGVTVGGGVSVLQTHSSCKYCSCSSYLVAASQSPACRHLAAHSLILILLPDPRSNKRPSVAIAL